MTNAATIPKSLLKSTVRSVKSAAISHLGFLLGCLGYFFMGAKKKIIQTNYQNLGYSAKDSLRLAIKSLGNYGRLLTEFARLSSIKKETVLHWGIQNENLVKAAFASGSGVVMATFHFGNWDLAGCSLGVKNYPFSVIADSVGPPWLNRRVIQARQAKGLRVIPTREAPRMIDAELAQKRGVAFLVDRPMDKGGVPVRFAGHTVHIPKGAMHYARKWNARLLVGYALRISAKKFRPTVVCEIPVVKTDNDASDLKVMGQAIMSEYEKLVRQHPEQWHMFRPFGRD